MTLHSAALLEDSMTPTPAFLERLWEQSTPNLDKWSPQHLSTALYACSQLAVEPAVQWLAAFWRQATRCIEAFNPQARSVCLFPLSTPASAERHAARAIVACILLLAPSSSDPLSPLACQQDLSLMIYATALLKLAPLVEWQVAFWNVGPRKFPEFSPQARST